VDHVPGARHATAFERTIRVRLPQASAGLVAPPRLSGTTFDDPQSGGLDRGQREPPLAVRGEPSSEAGTTTWPKVSTLRLDPVPAAAGQAREHARGVLRDWGLHHLMEDGVTLVSELVTNALQASWTLIEPAPVGLGLLANEGHLIIEAWDHCLKSTGFPAPDDPDEDDERGRGLLIVDKLSNRWGVRRPRNLGFKIVWCELLVSPRDAEHHA